MTYSTDFREHILSTKKKDNLTLRVTSKRFNVSIKTLFLWGKGLFPINVRNKTPSKISDEKLCQDVKEYPDAFQYERAERLGVSQQGATKNHTKKKTLRHPKADEEKLKQHERDR